jgi:hypothetical protein
MIAAHFQHPIRHFPGNVKRIASAPDSALFFAEIDGDKGLRNAVKFFWNAKGIAWSVSADIALTKIGTVYVDDNYTTGEWTYEYQQTAISSAGENEYAGRLYGDTETAKFPPPQRAVRLLNYYVGYGQEFVRADRTQPFSVYPSWRGQEDSYSENEESTGHPGYFIGCDLTMDITAFEIIYDELAGRYALDSGVDVTVSAYSPVDYTGPGPSGQFELLSGAALFSVGRTESSDALFPTVLTLPDIFDLAYLNRQSLPPAQTVDCIAGACDLSFDIIWWEYTEPPPE